MWSIVKTILGLLISLVVILSLAAGVLYFNEGLRLETIQFILKESNLVIEKPKSAAAVHKFDPKQNRQWIVKARPSGPITKDLFEFKIVPRPTIAKGQILIQNKYFSFDPTQRIWLAYHSYKPPVEINKPMEAVSYSVVVESKHPNFEVGDAVSGLSYWEDFTVVTVASKSFIPSVKLPKGVSPFVAMLMGTDFTAIGSLVNIGRVKTGDTVLVSGAAGATGSVAGQVAKLMGAKKVVGIAGGPDKVKLLKTRYKYDEAIDYKSENVQARIKEIAGNHGIDVYFDNVGGETLDFALENIAQDGRVIICGAISQYDNSTASYPGPKNYIYLLMKGASMEGFIVTKYLSDPHTILRWLYYQAIGKLTRTIDLRSNFDNMPETLVGLFKGTNVGKLVLENDVN